MSKSSFSLLEPYIGQKRFTSEKKHKTIDISLFDIVPTMQTKTGHIHVSIQAGKGPSCLATQIFLPHLWFDTVITTPTVSKIHLSNNCNECISLKRIYTNWHYEHKECIPSSQTSYWYISSDQTHLKREDGRLLSDQLLIWIIFSTEITHRIWCWFLFWYDESAHIENALLLQVNFHGQNCSKIHEAAQLLNNETKTT